MLGKNIRYVKNEYIIINLLKESMDHIRHLQQMRATYLNFYLVLYAAAIGAFAAIHNLSNVDKNFIELTSWIIGLFIWIMGLITIARAERFTGHFLHTLFVSRRLKRILQENNSLLIRELLKKPKLNATNEFKRCLFDPERSIDSLIAIICSITASLVWLIYPPCYKEIIGILIAIVLTIIPLVIWKIEVHNQERIHKDCCFNYPDKELLTEDNLKRS